MHDNSIPIPADDASLANLLSIWGYQLDEEQRVYLHRRGRMRGPHRDATCSMAYVRGLMRENPTIQDLREMLAGFAPARALVR